MNSQFMTARNGVPVCCYPCLGGIGDFVHKWSIVRPIFYLAT